MPTCSKPKAGGFTLSMETLPLDSACHLFAKREPEHFRSLCSILVAMADCGREDALTLLLGLAYRNRADLSRMLLFARCVRGLRHPEIVAFREFEVTSVASQPATRTYLATVLESLESIHTEESWAALLRLGQDDRVGPGYRARIREHLDSVAPPKAGATGDPTEPGV